LRTDPKHSVFVHGAANLIAKLAKLAKVIAKFSSASAKRKQIHTIATI
jgi:hypothetical protein